MKQRTQAVPNTQLKKQREQKQWTQTELARMIDTTHVNVSRWENGITTPSLYHRRKLCELFNKRSEELGFTALLEEVDQGKERPLPSSLLYWNVPHRRNLFFTGREAILTHLHTVLHPDKAGTLTPMLALCGLGGVGKTHIAIEYAYRYLDTYEAIWWARAATHDTLTVDFMNIANLLQLSEKEEQEQQHPVEAVKHWLNASTHWLLILDNVEDFTMVSNFLPINSSGSIILTTRTQSTGVFAQCIDVEEMQPDEGARFLLRRAKIIESGTLQEEVAGVLHKEARDISCLLDGLPLALDQAGAYIEDTGCTLSDYLSCYKARRVTLLDRRGNVVTDHPQSVRMTFSLCFEQVAQANPEAIELLRLCAFLAADAIPEELIKAEDVVSGPWLQPLATDTFAFDTAIAVLRTYSLLRRNTETRMLTIHRLVQAILKDELSEYEQRNWSQRVLHALARVFPEIEQTTQWVRCERLLPHVNVAFDLAERWEIASQEIGLLFENAGAYLREQSMYSQAEPLLEKAQAILLQELGPEHPNVYHSLHSLALLYWKQGRYAAAEPLFQRVLSFHEHWHESSESEARAILNDLAVLYLHQGRYQEAEPLFQRARALWEQEGKDSSDLASILNNLGLLSINQGHLQEAVSLLQRAVSMWERQSSPHPGFWGHTLNNLALVYSYQGRFDEAETLHQQALLLREQHFGPLHPDTALSLGNLASLYRQQKRYDEAAQLYQRSLAIRENKFGPDHLETAISVNGLASLYLQQGKYSEAEPLFRRALSIRERHLGIDHPDVVKCLIGLATLYYEQQQYHEAEPLFQRALALQERCFGSEHPNTKATAETYSKLRKELYGV